MVSQEKGDNGDEILDPVLAEVVEELISWGVEPTKELIRNELEIWIRNLYSHIGEAVHIHSLSCGVIDNTGMTWEEQDMYMLKQIEMYKRCLASLQE